MKKAYFLIVLILCGLSVGNLFASASAAAAAEEAAAGHLGQRLIEAVRRGNEPKVKELIARGADLNATQYGYTALMLAATRGHENIVKMLLQVDRIDVNATTHQGRTALMWAAIRGHENIVKMLLDAEADKTIKTKLGQTAEDLARAAGNEDLADMIRDYGSVRHIKFAGKR